MNFKDLQAWVILIAGLMYLILTTSHIYTEGALEYRDIQFNPFIESPFREDNENDALRVLVTISGVGGNCNTNIIISVAYQTQNQVLCNGDNRSFGEEKGEPIATEEFEFIFPKGEIKKGESVDVCVRAEIGFSNCKTLNIESEQQIEKVSFNLP